MGLLIGALAWSSSRLDVVQAASHPPSGLETFGRNMTRSKGSCFSMKWKRAAEYSAAKENGSRAAEKSALREVQRAAYGCWEFGIEECSEILEAESAFQALEEEAHRKIPFTDPPPNRAHQTSFTPK
jgi:hypothetical protein